ncbi:MAG: hypothetical protein H0X51_09920 [Parachlamydiaceae bacterium]|nr:hypothetical protein [Parachlamydiaceae bacterium]
MMSVKIRFYIFLLLACFGINSRLPALEEGEIREFFKDTLLIINFNHPYYDNIDFLKEIYAPHFTNIVFFGEAPHPEVNVVVSENGFFIHRVMKKALELWPNYKGYICLQDDCLLNYWNYPKKGRDRNKIWLHQYWTASLNTPKHWWPWWEKPYGCTASISAYSKLPYGNRRMLTKNCGNCNMAFSWADCFYIPERYRERFIALSSCFDNPAVFIEIAVPTMVLCLEEYDKIEKLNPYWGGTINSIDFANYSTDQDWVHPLKLSNPKNREFIRQVIAQMRENKYQ